MSHAPASSEESAGTRLKRAANTLLSPLKAVAAKAASSVHISLSELNKFSTPELVACLESGKNAKREHIE